MRLTTKDLCLTSLFTAIVFVMTFVPKIPIPLGYAHLGDAAVLLAVVLLGRKQGAIAGTVVGLATLVVTLFIIPRPLGIHPVIWSLGLNIVVFLIVSFATRPSDETVEKFFGAELDKISADQK